MKHETIIPLIGGVAIASEQAYDDTPPERIYSYEAFGANDSHLVNYYEQRGLDIPYHVLDAEGSGSITPSRNVDVVSTVCPCAGLSTLNHHASADNPLNDWMARTAEYVLGEIKPRVFWGENAPTFAGKTGTKIRQKIYEIGRRNGYTMSIFKTRSLDHGLPQYRGRSFYFFWKEKDSVPTFDEYQRSVYPIEDLLDSVKGNTQRELTNNSTPSENKFYRYALEEIMPGATHAEYVAAQTHSIDVLSDMVKDGKKTTFTKLAAYFDKKGDKVEADRCRRRQAKLDSGKGNMIRTVYLPKHRTGAFVGYMPLAMTHYREDRFLSYRECMSIMGLPEDFELLKPKKSLNHVCQNVPVTTARDMANEVYKYLEGKSPMHRGYQVFQRNSPGAKLETWDEIPNALEFA